MSTDGTDHDAGFADVLNGLTLGGGRRKRKKKAEQDGQPASADPADPVGPSGQEIVDRAAWSWTIPSSAPVVTPSIYPVTDEDLVADAQMVRPYAWTRGRTKSTVDLRIETMVSTSEHGENIEALTQTEHRSIAEICGEPRSVAEVATLLAVPLGVAKVLLGDMAGLGLVIVHKTATGGANKAHLTLMERVLSGLRRL
ncbi:DUF742 domain-containing protein [Actinophytocola algeriensis]|uniref:DUF742 domain-containing protein n=1 Tax=Actinophytocola algeriensis TaxID=1768010 RepID=A0A7W7QB39_9PSEU|nr:DUF742 domain-containing protein [Actinophytocola algeriensis]MBB4910178.1 hypothetical protein [Actinophytocola algeriensis]MBE1480833.1 hypothetical protein [Actinophytocola algeriensis]